MRVLPGWDAMLAKFNIDTHDEDEVRLLVAGAGLFHIQRKQGPVFWRIDSRSRD